jgi:hypothetical protein
MVKTLIIETELATLHVQELTGFSPDATSHFHAQMAMHAAGIDKLPDNLDGWSKALSDAGWTAVITYTRFVQQTRCIEWKVEPLFTLPSEYAAYSLHFAAFDAMRSVPSAFLKTWDEGCKQVSKTELDKQTEGKSEGE